MSACPLLDSFQKYLEMSVVFDLSICTATTTHPLLGMKVCYWYSLDVEGWVKFK